MRFDGIGKADILDLLNEPVHLELNTCGITPVNKFWVESSFPHGSEIWTLADLMIEVLEALKEFDYETVPKVQERSFGTDAGGRPERFSEAEKDEIRQFLSSGHSLAQTAARYGCSKSTIYRIKERI